MSVELLRKIPIDLLEQILAQLPIHDVLQLQKAILGLSKYYSVDLECRRRASVVRYLDNWFGDGNRLLDTMSKSKAYIWGPACLGFFVNTSAAEKYSWNFMCPYNGDGDALAEVLTSMGVRWLGCKDEIARFAELRQDSVIVSARFLRSQRSAVEEILKRCGKTLSFQDDGQSSTRLQLVMYNNVATVVSYAEAKDLASVATNSSNVVRGYILHKNVEINVLLHRTVFPANNVIRNTRLSCMQAVITSEVALHMYGQLASHLCTYDWCPSSSTSSGEILHDQFISAPGTEMLLKGQRNLGDRGWSICSYHTVDSRVLTRRSSRDCMSTLIVHRKRRAGGEYIQLQDLRWYDSTSGPVNITSCSTL